MISWHSSLSLIIDFHPIAYDNDSLILYIQLSKPMGLTTPFIESFVRLRGCLALGVRMWGFVDGGKDDIGSVGLHYPRGVWDVCSMYLNGRHRRFWGAFDCQAAGGGSAVPCGAFVGKAAAQER